MKPITVARQEFIENLSELINQSGLPAFAIADILQNTLPVLHDQAQMQYTRDLSEMEKEEKKEE